MSPNSTITAPPTCRRPWCRSESTTTVGTTRPTAHSGAATPVAAPPDVLNVYLVAIDDQAPNVVIEPTGEDPSTLVLAVDQAEHLVVAAVAAVASNTGRPA